MEPQPKEALGVVDLHCAQSQSLPLWGVRALDILKKFPQKLKQIYDHSGNSLASIPKNPDTLSVSRGHEKL